ncbi:PAP2 superfamily protein [Nitzschia inconspicua]|uniref:PAP2 superfamily protein n=1 Tax=Nitzschia inconspicua TaxID=303405 RepID=A0A9K3KCJ1_9STRA|nr:PAP2 superfamily protein [Nitzschia inconspicua]
MLAATFNAVQGDSAIDNDHAAAATAASSVHLMTSGNLHNDTPGNEHSYLEQSSFQPVATWPQYLASWRFLELLLCLIPFILGSILEVAFQPHQRPIPYQYLESTGDYIVNQMFNEVLEGETVPSIVLVVGMGWIPCLLQLLLAWFSPTKCHDRRHRWDVLHRTACVYAAGLGTTILVTDALKLYVGYLRPIFYDQCQPDETFEVCQNDDRQIRLSFPSGHASLSVCGMLLISQYLEQCFGAYRRCYHRHWNTNGVNTDNSTRRVDSAMELDVTTGRTTVVLPSSHGFRLSRIFSLLCYSPMLIAFFVGTYMG